ncbi:MAG: T9SS type A sorting domain-containing protein [Dysgonamonadaceae bacterium]|jgi:hypothetical protein|nr:T9SS type A sorting domain-containing protein [Dysgonamonadaceae bacterium]
MKKYLLLFFFLLTIAGGIGAQTGYLYVHTTATPDKQTFALDDLKSLTFTDSEMQIATTNGPETVLLSDLMYFTLKGLPPTNLPPTAAAISSIEVYSNLATGVLTVISAQALTGLELYDLQGQKLLQLTPDGSLTVEVSLSDLPAGIYLLRVADETGNVTIKKTMKH